MAKKGYIDKDGYIRDLEGHFMAADQIPQELKENAVHESILLRDAVRPFLAKLSLKERQVIELRFGLVDDRDRSLDDVAAIMDTTPEDVIALEQQAILALRRMRPLG